MNRHRIADRVRPMALAGLVVFATGDAPLRDEPVAWHEDDRRHVPEAPARRRVTVVRDGIEETLYRPLGRLVNPGRLVRKVGTIFGGDHVPPARNVNALDEALNSTWFTNRIGLFPITLDAVARGPATDAGPDRTAPLVVSEKSEGVTPGFEARDAGNVRYVVKFDPPGFLGMASAADVITSRILHAAGYNVPEDFIVEFERDDFVVGEGVQITDTAGFRRPMTEADLDALLDGVDRLPSGRWRALASRYLSGRPIGPFSWTGRRDDDPNDHVPHEDRRELRGLRVFASWLCHFDTKQGNTLDMFVEEGETRFVRHYLIDFASTLGAGATGPFPLGCFEYQFDLLAILGRSVSLGLHEDPWRRIERPGTLPEVGYFEDVQFDPGNFKPLNPNTAFANVTDRDGYWAAKIISAFSDEHLEALVAQGRYRDSSAARWIAEMLKARRNAVARYWFDRIPPLDFFTVEGGVVRFRDLGSERAIYREHTPRYRSRVRAATATRGLSGSDRWMEGTSTLVDPRPASEVDPDRYPFFAVEVQVDRGEGWSQAVVAYIARASGRVTAVDR